MRSRTGSWCAPGQSVHAFDNDFPVGVDLNEGAHLLQEQHRIDDLRLNRSVVDHGGPFGETRREYRILGGPDTGVGQRDHGALKPVGPGGIAVVVLVDLRAHLPQQVDVEVDGPFADVAAAHDGNARHAGPVEQGSDQQDGNPIETGIAFADGGRRDPGRRYVDGPVLKPVTGRTDLLQHGEDDIDFGDVRHVVQPTGFPREKRGDELLGDRVLGCLGANAPM